LDDPDNSDYWLDDENNEILDGADEGDIRYGFEGEGSKSKHDIHSGA